MHWVFAYGSNMDLDDLARWCDERGQPLGTIERAEPALLPGHRLIWNYRSQARRGGAANVARDQSTEATRALPGLALFVDEIALATLDVKEGHPARYDRGPAPRRARLCSGEGIEAWVYVVRPEFTLPELVPPTRAYREILLRVAARHGFPAWYLAELAALPTAD